MNAQELVGTVARQLQNDRKHSGAVWQSRRVVWRVVIAVALMLSGTLTSHAEEAPSTPRSIKVVAEDNHPPYVFRDEEGAVHGYLIDLWELWADANGIEVALDVQPPTKARAQILSGAADVIDAVVQNQEQNGVLDYGPPYASVQIAIYSDRSLGELSTASELAGFTVGVNAGDACGERLMRQGNVRVVEFEGYTDLITAAKAGEVPVFCMPDASAEYYLYQMGVQQKFSRRFDYFQARMYFGVREGNAAMLRLVADGMARIDKQAIAALNRKWLGGNGASSAWIRYAGYAGILASISLLLLATWNWSLRKAVLNKTAELVQGKASLRESEERFRRLFEDTNQAIALVENGVYVAANEATLKLLGMTHMEQFIGLTPLDISALVLPDGRVSADEAPRMIAEADAKGAHEFEWVHLRADGDPVDVRVMLTRIRIDQRDLLHVVWNDISAQKRAEAEGKRLNEELEARVAERTAELARMTESLSMVNREQQAIFDATTVGVMFVVKRQIMRCNRAMEALFGRSSEEMVGQTTRMLYPDQETFEAVGELVSEKLKSKGRFVEEVEMIRADGSLFCARLSAQRLAEDVPNSGYVTIIEDTTAERNAFRAMQKAKMLAEEATRLKSDFVANMSHEIRTPMTGILGMTELILQEGLPPRQEAYLRKIEGAGKHLLALLNDILDFSKIEAGKMIIEEVSFSLAAVLERGTAMIAEQARGKGLAFEVTVAPDVPDTLVGDPVRVAQVLSNYATNAVKFTESGRIDVSVDVVERQKDEIVLRMSVRDTGCGIDAEQCKRLFSSFQQADSSITRKHGGTGLGLAISRQLAEHMKGAVGVTSTPGQGSEFWFTVQLGIGAAQTTPHSTNHGVQRPRPHPARLSALRILLVEDNLLNQEVALALLSHYGIQADLAVNGAIAVEKVQEARYDLVLMDMQMPVMDGLAATRAIRALPGGHAIPIIAMTANAMASDRNSCLAAGMNDHIGKPIDIDQLISRISKWTKVEAVDETPVPLEMTEAPAESSSPVADETSKAIPVLDTEGGLRRSLGREALYARTLSSFVVHFSASAEKLNDALGAQDGKALTLAAHSLKGAAAQVGALQLSEHARQLESDAKSNADVQTLAHGIERVRESTATTLASIAVWLEGVAPSEKQAGKGRG